MRDILITSSALILALLALRLVLRRRLSARVQYALWGLVLLRLLVPFSLPASSFSVLSAAQAVQQAAEERMELQPPVRPGAGASALPEGVHTVGRPGNGIQAVPQAPAASAGTAVEGPDIPRQVWICGMVLVGGYFLYANVHFYLMLRKRRTACPAEGYPHPVWLVEEGLPSPCLFGGAVYLTPAAAASEDRTRHVLAHEDVHARHLDPLWSLLRCVCLTVYWFDPLVWVAAVVSRTDCELACDESALAMLGEAERIAYGETLLSLIPVKAGPGDPFLAATTMTSGKKQLRDRIARVATRQKQLLAAVLATVVLAGAMAACAFTGAVSPEPAGPADPPLPTPSSTPSPDLSGLLPDGGSRPLTWEEIDLVNEAFYYQEETSADGYTFIDSTRVSGFFTSWYDDVRELDFSEFLYYYPDELGDMPVDEAEFRELTRLPGWSFGDRTLDTMMVPTHRHRRADIDDTLTRYAGITTADLKDTSDVLYLKEYDAWYNFTSDFGPGFFICDSGTVYGDRAVLWGQGPGSRAELTLVRDGDSWHIRSFLPVDDAPSQETVTARAAYQELLRRFLNDHILPDGTALEPYELGGGSIDQFAVTDVDGDGREELVLLFESTAMANVCGYVIGCDPDSGDTHIQLAEFPWLEFYDNGTVKAMASHNQSYGEMWPYSLYLWSPDTDTYQYAASVSACDRDRMEEMGGQYPEERDVSGTGTLYYVDTGASEDWYDTPLDETDYESWLFQYVPLEVEVLQLPFLPVTEENIAALTVHG